MACDPTRALLPAPTGRTALDRWTVLLQLGVAWLLTAPAILYAPYRFPGQAGLADLPGTVNLHWLVHQRGLVGAAHSRMLMYPNVVDRLVIDGFPLDALFSWPFTAALGWPTGFTVFVTACLFALGCSTAWMARVWWGDVRVGMVAGVVAQANPFLIRELVDGRPTQIFGAIFLPLALGLAVRAVTHGRRRDGLLAGACIGLGALSYWYYGVFFSLAVGLLLAIAAWDRRTVLRPALAMAAGTTAVALAPILYTIKGIQHFPGANINWSQAVNHGGHAIELTDLLVQRSLLNTAGLEGTVAPQMLTFALVIIALARSPLRRWLTPVVWLGFGFLMALGPSLALPGTANLTMPFALFGEIGGLRRLWWPDRFLVLALPSVAILASGGWVWLLDRWRPARGLALWAPALMALVLVGEAYLTVPGLPLPTTSSKPSVNAQILARRSGPALILPLGSGDTQPDATMLVDQIHHGRPLVNGPMPPKSSTAPTAYFKFVDSPGLAYFHACEQRDGVSPTVTPATVHGFLAAHGITEVYLDRKLAGRLPMGTNTYQACIERILETATLDSGPLWIYPVSAAS